MSIEKYLPLSTSNFFSIRKKGCFYADKTSLINEITYKNCFIIHEISRFGKSLAIQTISTFFDINTKKEDFISCFKGLEIWGLNDDRNVEDSQKFEELKKEKQACECYILKLDFLMNTNPPICKVKFSQFLHSKFLQFSYQYCKDLSKEFDENNFEKSLLNIFHFVQSKQKSLLILIDEFDYFFNNYFFKEILSNDLQNEINHFLKSKEILFDFLSFLKTNLGNFDLKIACFGIHPLLLSNVSQANFLQNCHPKYRLGLTEEELRISIKQMQAISKNKNKGVIEENNSFDEKDFQEENFLILFMKKFYNGYKYFDNNETYFNSTLSLYFLRSFFCDPIYKQKISKLSQIEINEENLFLYKQDIISLAENNTRISSSIFKFLIQYEPLCVNELIKLKIGNTFSVPNFKNEFISFNNSPEDRINLVYLVLYHCGLISIENEFIDQIKKKQMVNIKIPNLFVKIQLNIENHLIKKLHLGDLLSTFVNHPVLLNCKLLFEYIFSKYYVHSDNQTDEATIQKVIQIVFNLSKNYYKCNNIDCFFEHRIEKSSFSSSRIDLRLEIKNSADVILIEIKRIRPNSINQNHLKLISKNDENQVRKIGYGNKIEEKNLYHMRFNEKGVPILGNQEQCKTIGEVEISALNQLMFYRRKTSESENKQKNIHCFSLIHYNQNSLLISQLD